MNSRPRRLFSGFIRAWIGTACLVALVSVAAKGRADDTNPALFQNAVKALDTGDTDGAIDRFELLADRGFSHPDASYDRAIAYVRRGQSPSAKPGDWGRAAAALEETLLNRPGDADARVALERVHKEIAMRRARSRAADVELEPSLGWALVGVLDERTWALLAALGSLVTSVGLVARARVWVRSSAVRLAGVVASGLGALTLVVAGTLAFFSRQERLSERPAVVIVEEARLLDENGAAISGPGTRIPEGALVNVRVDSDAREQRQRQWQWQWQRERERGSLVHVDWGTIDGWLSLGQLRLLSRS